jgi:phospholipid N-methyltransferase
LDQRWRFLKGYLGNPNTVGSVAPSSRSLAAALCEPYRRFEKAAAVLEVGAGTGAITRHLGALLSREDELDICEIQADFADILERDVLTRADLAPGVDAGRVRLLRTPVQELSTENRYDFIISGLPLSAFELRDVRDVFGVVRRSLKPGGVFSYFEYMGLRRTSYLFAVGKRRQRIRSVSSFLSQKIHDHQIYRRAVLANFPPAHARHLRFDP